MFTPMFIVYPYLDTCLNTYSQMLPHMFIGPSLVREKMTNILDEKKKFPTAAAAGFPVILVQIDGKFLFPTKPKNQRFQTISLEILRG